MGVIAELASPIQRVSAYLSSTPPPNTAAKEAMAPTGGASASMEA
jgi:hypothetical protein